MSHAYRAVGWNRQKRIYDLTLLSGVLVFIAAFVGGGLALHPDITAETLIIRALGACAFVLLHVILCIGPLCRLDDRFLPLLFNRRHLGVTMFLLALGHGLFSIVQFHALGDLNPLVSVLSSNGELGRLSQFPFQPLGVAALAILYVMAATSHDFWLANLSAPIWKSLHMLVYVAYGLIVLHVALGVVQAETSNVLPILMAMGFVLITTLHLLAGLKERPADAEAAAADGYVDVCHVDEIADDRARIACIAGERVAVFKYEGKVSAVSNVCQHQNGPLGEGKIVDGCVTCPWHGYQYEPETGASPERAAQGETAHSRAGERTQLDGDVVGGVTRIDDHEHETGRDRGRPDREGHRRRDRLPVGAIDEVASRRGAGSARAAEIDARLGGADVSRCRCGEEHARGDARRTGARHDHAGVEQRAAAARRSRHSWRRRGSASPWRARGCPTCGARWASCRPRGSRARSPPRAPRCDGCRGRRPRARPTRRRRTRCRRGRSSTPAAVAWSAA